MMAVDKGGNVANVVVGDIHFAEDIPSVSETASTAIEQCGVIQDIEVSLSTVIDVLDCLCKDSGEKSEKGKEFKEMVTKLEWLQSGLAYAELLLRGIV